MENTTWLCGEPAKTCVLTNSRQITERLAELDGQKPRRRQENVSKYCIATCRSVFQNEIHTRPQSVRSNETVPNTKDSFRDVWVCRLSPSYETLFAHAGQTEIKNEASHAK